MNIRVEKAIDLYNMRTRLHNIGLDREEHVNTLNAQRLGIILYGGEGISDKNSKKYRSIAVKMNSLMKGKIKYIQVDHVAKICEALGVDPNFLFGFPSKHDKELLRIQEKYAAILLKK